MSEKVTNYCVIVHPDIDEFVQEVAEAVENGWQPLGGLVTANVDGKIYFYQSLVETDPEA